MRKLILAGVLLLALTLILPACGGTATTPTPKPTSTLTPTPVLTPTPALTTTPAPTPPSTATPVPSQANVNISGFAFVPQTLSVPPGTTVTWTNNDSTSHTIASNDNLFQSGALAKGATFSHTFAQKGTFNYHCSIHPSMTGKIIVE